MLMETTFIFRNGATMCISEIYLEGIYADTHMNDDDYDGRGRGDGRTIIIDEGKRI